MLDSSDTMDGTAGINFNAVQLSIKEAIGKIASDDLELSDQSSQVVESYAQDSMQLLEFILENLLSSSALFREKDSTKYLRYTSCMSRIMSFSEDHFQACQKFTMADIVLGLCRSTDVLVQLIAAESLPYLSKTKSGLFYLLKNGHVKWLVELSCGSDLYQSDPLLVSMALREVSNILKQALALQVPIWNFNTSESSDVAFDQPFNINDSNVETISQMFLHPLVTHMESGDEVFLLAGMYAASSFAASSYSTLKLVLDDHNVRDAWFSVLNRKVDLQASCLNSIAQVMDAFSSKQITAPAPSLDNNNNMNSTESDLLKQLYLEIGRTKGATTANYLVKLIREPIVPLKHAACNVFRSLCTLPYAWALETVMGGGGHTVWSVISDVTVEVEKSSMEWRFSIVDAVAANPLTELLSAELRSDVENKKRRGPFHRPAANTRILTMEL